MQIQTDYKIGQDNVTPFGLDIHYPVFIVSSVTIILFILYALLFQDNAAEFFGWLRPAVTDTFDWFFLLAGNFFVLFACALIFTPLGKVRLGGQDAQPDFGYPAWFAMLFAAGMGIGLVYFGVSEPISHFNASMGGVVAEGGTRTDWAPLGAAAGDAEAARRLAMAATIYHWGLHPWAIYAVVALALAFFSYNHNLPLTLRSAFYPLLGEKVWGWHGHVIDTLAVFATLFGLATSLGFGATQVLAGFNFLYGWGTGTVAIIVLISAITLTAMISVVSGLNIGIKRLSQLNMIFAAVLLLVILLVGPTAEILLTAFTGGIAYIKALLPLSVPFGRADANFSQDWTAFYWAWWISWSPFVGMFIARISRGRTVREFVLCVILLPTLLCTLWMATFGGAAISQVVADAAAPVGSAAAELKLFEMVKAFPLTGLLSFIGIALLLVFFVTSSDSGSLVIDTITAGGKHDAPVIQRVFWSAFEGITAIVLLLAGGAETLSALRAMVVSTGLPFTIVLLAMCISTWIGLRAASKALP